METFPIVDVISRTGALGLLVLIVLGSMREWWFTGAAYRRLEKERDEWKAMALRSLNTADRAVTLVEHGSI